MMGHSLVLQVAHEQLQGVALSRRAWGLTLLGAAWALPARAAPVDVLDRPAVSSARAASALMLAVTRAGRRLVAVGERGIVQLSDDDGRTWRHAQVPVSTTLTGVSFADAKQGWAVGHGGTVLHSADGGQTWRRQLEGRQVAQLTLAAAQALPEGEVRNRAVRDAEFLVKDGPDKPLFDVDFRNAKEGLVVGAYGMALATADGGVSWRAVGAQIPNGKGRHLMRISRLGARTWITGEQASLFTAGSDGVYAEVAVPYNGTLFGLLPLSDSSWLAYGLRGNAFLSQDEGRNWVKVSLPEPVTLTHALKATSGLLLVDQSGRLLGSADAVAFTPRNSAPLAPINAAAEAADQALVLATVRGMVRIEPVQRLAGKS